MDPPPGKHWQYTPEKLDEMDARGEIYWSSNGNPRRKVYFDNSPGLAVQDIWTDFRDSVNQNDLITGYPTEKNPDILRRIIKASSDPGDFVLDVFCGSGTTLGVAEELNRNWIGVDSSKEAINACIKRFTNGLDAMGDFVTTNKPQQISLLEANKPLKSNFSFLKDTEIRGDKELIQKWKNALDSVYSS